MSSHNFYKIILGSYIYNFLNVNIIPLKSEAKIHNCLFASKICFYIPSFI